MKKHYILSPLFLLTLSCATQVSYIGNTYAPTEKIAVFVDESSMKNEYEIVGKGYIERTPISPIEHIQTKAIEKAKKNGADAILIKDYFVPNTGTAINTTTHIDSVGKGVVAVGQTTVQQTNSTGFYVWFLKRKQKS